MPKTANVAVILSGCGVFDGSEIHESVLTLLALARAGATVTCAAPEITQRHVINHATGEEIEIGPKPASIRVRATPLKRLKEMVG